MYSNAGDLLVLRDMLVMTFCHDTWLKGGCCYEGT